MTKAGERMADVLVSGTSRLSRFREVPVIGPLLRWAGRRFLPANKLIWVRVQHGPASGLWIRVNPRTGGQAQMGGGEAAVQAEMVAQLRPGMTFYDLGANMGFFSLLGARLVGASGKVISFEADPEIAERLRENLSYNGFEQATVEQKAVWSKDGAVSFARADTKMSPDRGLGHVVAGNTAGEQMIRAEAVCLDGFVGSHPAPDFIKCDVEGAEVAVFAGAERLLREKRPVVLVEMHNVENRAVLVRKFEELGYRCKDVDANHVLALPG
ncbi:MAG TPA: FkbM family methyltransferase [Candidatus Eremiobacteraceae bacterium]|nr:FkbM family methyltransferase [Candidatus Eremiobacteraceae bacterium]